MNLRPIQLFAGLLFTTTIPVARVAAQDPALVESLATLLRAQDQRRFDSDLFNAATLHPDPTVRRAAALAIGRVGDRQGSGMLVRMLDDRDPSVLPDVLFALGLLRDSTTTDAIIRRLKSTDTLTTAAIAEAATALIRIGNPGAATFVESVLKSPAEISRTRRDAFVPNAVLDAWHLASRFPADAILPFATDTSADLRWRAIYALGRARSPVGGKIILRTATDPNPLLREAAVKSLTKRLADSAALPLANVRNALVRGLDDQRPGVRVNALAAVATFADTSYLDRITPLLGDPDQNVRVAAAEALGTIRGGVAARALAAAFDRKDATWALQRTALSALARIDTGAFAARAATWLRSPDVRNRLTALAGWGSVKGADPAIFRAAMTDPEPAVQAAALQAWRSATTRTDSAVLAAARTALTSPKTELRETGARLLQGVSTADDLDGLLQAWRMSANDADGDTRLALFSTLRDLARRVPSVTGMLEAPGRSAFFARPSDPLLRRAAEQTWPEVAVRWGAVVPFETGKSLEDYRGIVRTLMLAKANPHVVIETESRGTVEIELLAHDAPLTVANFLRLVDRHYFDGIRWHRVVPNFVVQAGDPTGTGSGGPGWSIRDEINPLRYELPMMGMALSGPDTGGSQWFINLSSQPHLDGGYTIFGRVVGSYVPLQRIVQGDLIRTIHR